MRTCGQCTGSIRPGTPFIAACKCRGRGFHRECSKDIRLDKCPICDAPYRFKYTNSHQSWLLLDLFRYLFRYRLPQLPHCVPRLLLDDAWKHLRDFNGRKCFHLHCPLLFSLWISLFVLLLALITRVALWLYVWEEEWKWQWFYGEELEDQERVIVEEGQEKGRVMLEMQHYQPFLGVLDGLAVYLFWGVLMNIFYWLGMAFSFVCVHFQHLCSYSLCSICLMFYLFFFACFIYFCFIVRFFFVSRYFSRSVRHFCSGSKIKSGGFAGFLAFLFICITSFSLCLYFGLYRWRWAISFLFSSSSPPTFSSPFEKFLFSPIEWRTGRYLFINMLMVYAFMIIDSLAVTVLLLIVRDWRQWREQRRGPREGRELCKYSAFHHLLHRLSSSLRSLFV
ncbi:hypothetical protein QOT17_020548 [Balamuthia mandrillaris]